MAFDINSYIGGGLTVGIVVILAVLALVSLLFGKAKEQIKYVLTKLYRRTSLMLIAIFDVVAAFDPSQTILGLAIGPIAGIAVFLTEWVLEDKFKANRLGPSLIEGFIAAIIVMIPLPVAGIFVAWFGVLGDKKKK